MTGDVHVCPICKKSSRLAWAHDEGVRCKIGTVVYYFHAACYLPVQVEMMKDEEERSKAEADKRKLNEHLRVCRRARRMKRLLGMVAWLLGYGR